MAVSSTTATGTSVLDVGALVSSLMTVERAPLDRLDARIGAANTRISSLGSFVAKVGTLKSALDRLADASRYNGRVASSSNAALVGVSATAAAAAGELDVQVRQTAQGQQSLIGGFGATTDAVGAGTLSIALGATSVSLSTDATTTLDDLAAQVNASGAGVQASVVQTGSGEWSLLLRSSGVGAGQAFSVAGSGALDAGTHALSTPQAARDAEITVNGIRYTRAGNSFANVLPGVTLTLGQPVSPADPAVGARVSIASTNANAQGDIQDLVTAYNEAYGLYQSLTRPSTDRTLRGPLNADASLASFMGKVGELMAGGLLGADGTRRVRLADAGITTGEDGTLRVDANKLSAALGGTLGQLLAEGGASFRASATGVHLGSFVREALGSNGALGARQAGARLEVKQMSDQRTALEGRLALTEARLKRQYASLDAQLSQMQRVSLNLASALDALTAQNQAT